VREDDGKEV